MGDSKLCLLLLLSTSALAFAQGEGHPTCLLAQRYKTLHKYQYQYEAESLNAINGASHLKNGPKASCKVEIEVPQTCSFIVRTTGCMLSEVVDVDAEGNPVFRPASSSDTFAAEMEKHPLKVVVEGEYDVKLYPEDGETTTILNFKRGIISALAVPLLEEEKNKHMPTIHGKCKTQYSINTREDIATDITLNRDLSRCDQFVPMRDHNSPLAIISGMHYPLAQLIRSSQTCNYKFDNEKKHMTSGSCTENHILIPFSHKGKYGVTNVGKQEISLIDVSAYNDRVFEHSDIVKELHMETVEDKSAIQDKEAALNLIRELAGPEIEGEKRAHLFQSIVSMVRGMKTETLRDALPEAIGVSRFLTYQILAQCGTPECSSAIMQVLRTFDTTSLEVDATIFALGLMSNPSGLLIHDMLEMAKYKHSKPIMYALSNVVKRFYKAEGKLIPEIHSVAEFMAAELGDCTGDQDQTFMTLRVIGNMAPAVIPAGPALKQAVIQCVKQTAATHSVQEAAIQVFRQIPVPHEDREVFMHVILDKGEPVQERIAAYLVLMKDPQPSELTQLVHTLPSDEDQQVKSFFISHITNILSSTDHETQELRQKIHEALQGNEIGTIMDPIRYSRNYKIGSLEGNMIFEDASYLPKEVMLDMTLKAFGFEIDMMEFGMEGKGFEPTVDALFGEDGFFPDTALKTMYFVSDNMPDSVSEILHNIMPALNRNRMRREVSQNLIKEIGQNLHKLVTDLKAAESPEAMVYVRLLGNELGYLRTNDIEELTYSAGMMIDSMLKMFPHDVMKAILTRHDSSIFAHYIFMDNEFFLPTVTGVPLKIALSGTFAPGFKGGLDISRDMSTVAFMPSAGIEFVTQIGSHIPEYVNSGLEMHTNIFHESGVTAKISMARDHVKLTIPSPTKPTKLIKMTNTLVAVVGSEVKTITPLVMDKVDVDECTPVFAGMKYCTALQYIDAFSDETAPYFPFTGDSKFAVELHPTGEVTEYTATVAYELLKEGEEARQKVDSLKFILRAEGAEPTEATAVMKYNRRKNVISADIHIPDYDVEAGLRLGVGNTKSKGTHSISLDFINKNILQLSLVGRANLKAMKEGMLEVQLLVPSINADATVTAKLKRDEELELELESEIKLMDAISEQKIEIKYDGSKIEAEIQTDMNTKTASLPNGKFIEEYGNEILDMQVGQTDMKVRHIFRKFVEAGNNYMEKYGAQMFPYMQNFRLPDIPDMSMPEKLFLNTDSKAVYYFNNEYFTINIPLPLGGKSTDELNFPPVLTTPSFSLPKFGLEIVSMEIPIPELVVPESLTLSIPFFGKAEFSTMMTSNLYDLEASVAAGKDVVEPPSYSARFDVKGTSPIDILSVAVEGSGLVATTDSIKAHVKGSLSHKFIEASISIEEDAAITDKVNVKSISNIEARSPFGFDIKVEHTGMAGASTDEITADNKFEGMFKAGPMYSKTISTQSFNIFPFRPEAKIESSVQFDSTFVKAQNTIAATLAKGEFLFESNTKAFEDLFTHVAKLSFKDNKLSMKCEASALALGMKIHNQAEAAVGAGEIVIRIETNGDHSENRVYSLTTASLDVNGLNVNCDANVKLLENEAMHKTTLKMNKDGLTTSGTTTIQSPLSFENTFNAGLDTTKGTLSIINKAAMFDMKFDNTNTMAITLSSFDFNSKAEVTASEYASYTQDITFDLKPYTASANVNNHLKFLVANFINEAQLQAELYKMDITGSMKAMFGEEEIKHTYQINYADLTASAKCSTTGKLLGTQMNHNTELEIIGLAARFNNNARFNSQPMRFDHTIRCSIVPFDFNLDAIFNADGDMTLYGKHSAQLYGKFLLRAQPLVFASSHECRASVTQQLDNGFSLETTYDNKMDTVMSLQEQKTRFRIKSKMNEHAFSQNFEVYNTPETIGVEVSSTILTNIINTASKDNQELSISGFFKYDKNTESHTIQFPLIESLPVFLEGIKEIVVHVAEALHGFINYEGLRDAIENFPDQVSDFAARMDFEDKVFKLKQYFSDLPQTIVISIEDVEVSLGNLKTAIEKLPADLYVYIQYYSVLIMDFINNNKFLENVIQKTQEGLKTIIESNDIKAAIVYVIDTIREMINNIDLEKLRGSSIAFLEDIEDKYEIKAALQSIMIEVKHSVERFDLVKFISDLKRFITTINKILIREYVAIPLEQFSYKITYFTKKIIQDFDIAGKISTFFAKMRELFVHFEVDQKLQTVLEKVVDLIKQFKIEDSMKAVVQMVKNLDIPTKFQDAITYLKTTDVKDIIDHLSVYIETIVQKLKSLDYNDFVDHANQVIAEYTTQVNEMIRTLEIPHKLEATREFINTIITSIHGIVEGLRELKVAEIIKKAEDFFEQFVCDPLKISAKYIKDDIINLDFTAEISSFIQFVGKNYREAMKDIIQMFSFFVHIVKDVLPDQKIISEIQQILDGLLTELMQAEISTPSFTLPLTDLVVPSMKFKMDSWNQFVLPTQLDIPEFTIMGVYTMKATTLSYDSIKQKIIELIDFIVNFKISMFDADAIFGDLTLNYFPALPEITLPEITLPELTFPTIPQVPVEKLVKSLRVPKIKLPTIPAEIMVPGFGRLRGEIKFHSPIFTVKTNVEFQNSTETQMTPLFTGFFTSQGTSPSWEILNYNLDTTTRISMPKMKRIVLAETVKFTHAALGAEHQGSVTLYGKSAQAQVKTTIKVSTTPYTADFSNTAFIGVEGGMTGTVDTSYSHVMNIPIANVRNEVTVTQKSIVRQEGFAFTLSADHTGTGKFNGHDGNHNSKFLISCSPSIVSLTFSGDTESEIFKMKQQVTAEIGTFSLKFNIRNEAEAPCIRNSLIVATGYASLHDMKIEMKANHDTELHGADTGSFSNAINFIIHPVEFNFEFQNKGNAKVNIFRSLTAKIDLQNDYLVNFNHDSQKMNTLFLARLNQYKMLTNFTLENDKDKAGVFVAMDGETNLDFLKYPISIPEIDLPFVEFHTPAISDLNLYEQTGLQNILTTTEQTVDVDAKIVYQKSKAAPIVMGLIPSIGNLITDLSFKSAIINLNANAGLFPEDDLVFRLSASTASVFECLKARIDGTTSLSTKRGIKLANSLSLVNDHIEGNHDSSFTMSAETFETAVSVATVGKIVSPVFNLEASQNLNADTKSKANALSTFKIKGDINMPMIKTVGEASADHNLKLEGTFEYVSMESTIKTSMGGTVFENYLVLGVLDNEANFYLNKDGLRSTSKIIGEARLNNGETKVLSMGGSNNLAIEASMGRVYVDLMHVCNNEANLFDFTTKGKHLAQAKIDFAPISSLKADFEIDMTQPCSLGEFKFFEKTVAEMTPSNQKISNKVKFVSPVYTTDMDVEVEGNAPVLKIVFKSSATSAFVVLEYNLDASSTLNFENDLLNMVNKLVLTHTDLTMDVSHTIAQALRRKRQADESVSRHTMNVDVTSPTFTDMNLRYAAHRDAISASVSSPSAGFLGLQFNGKFLSQMNARLYFRLPSAPEADINILVIRTSKDADKINLQIVYVMESIEAMLNELKGKLPSIMSSAKAFADKYHITANLVILRDFFINYINEAYNIATNYDAQMSQLSIFFRNTVTRYQKTIQTFFDAIIKVFRETRFKLPGSGELTTLPELLKKLTSSIANMLGVTVKMIREHTEEYYDYFVQKISNVKVQMPVGDVITGGQVIDQVKITIRKISDEVVDIVKNMESLDTMLEKISETLKAVVEKTQEFVDTVKSDYLDAVFMSINQVYREFVKAIKNIADQIPAFSMEEFQRVCESILDMIITKMANSNLAVNHILQQASEETKEYIKVTDGNFELNFPFYFQH
ncbi:apolipoprotein Bb, tandem duplicate 1 [Melanotaenia boesemani]|uniref:apolipoprotein Bb, tandem duplicate 1 n=1 Tax=Melanotaenia boesemani TaxID=1250792 RepID=UPI001C045720|nr:apolipoprotein Bb, tandem duplicate 1 [Melanotaenia boesemani]